MKCDCLVILQGATELRARRAVMGGQPDDHSCDRQNHPFRRTHALLLHGELRLQPLAERPAQDGHVLTVLGHCDAGYSPTRLASRQGPLRRRLSIPILDRWRALDYHLDRSSQHGAIPLTQHRPVRAGVVSRSTIATAQFVAQLFARPISARNPYFSISRVAATRVKPAIMRTRDEGSPIYCALIVL